MRVLARMPAAERESQARGDIGGALDPHAFGETRGGAVTDVEGGLRGDVTGGKPGAAGGHDQVKSGGQLAQQGGDQVALVGHQFPPDGLETGAAQQGFDGGSGEIFALASRGAVTDGDHGGGPGKDGSGRGQARLLVRMPGEGRRWRQLPE